MSIFSIQTPQDSVGFQFWKLHQQWQKRVAEALSSYQITHTQFVMMASIAWFGEQHITPSQAQVSALMQIDKMAFSKAIRQLENKGFVLRNKHQQDARIKCLTLTEHALHILPQAMQAIDKVDNKVFSLGERKAVFTRILVLLNKKLSKR